MMNEQNLAKIALIQHFSTPHSLQSGTKDFPESLTYDFWDPYS